MKNSSSGEMDKINPDHYKKGEVECIDAIESAVMGLDPMEAYLTGSIIKYIWRWKHKNGIEDLKKADWFLKKLSIEAGGSHMGYEKHDGD